MAKVFGKSYTSPTLILLALDWPEAKGMTDFLGFAIQRKPGFRGAVESWLGNRIGFDGPPKNGFLDSNVAPIQKFMWWDAQIDTADRGGTFTYSIWPVRGTPNHFAPVEAAKGTIQVTLPHFVENRVGTWFNRAVVSSQAFSRLCDELKVHNKADLTEEKERKLRAWLANGMEEVVPSFLASSGDIAGAIYHLEDRLWVLPALRARGKPTAMVYDSRNVRGDDGEVLDSPNIKVIGALAKANKKLKFFGRDKTNIMHNKILVELAAGKTGRRVLCGSANFTSGGLSSQANVLHVWDSPELAQIYRERVEFLQENPLVAATQKKAVWSKWVKIGGAEVRVCFAPETKPGKKAPKGAGRIAMDPIIKAVAAAKSSVVFCLFTPTDKELRDACFAQGDKGRMMFGLVNQIKAPKKKAGDGNGGGKKIRADQLAKVEIYHRSRSKKDVVGAEHFSKDDLPAGFLAELKAFPGAPQGGKIPPVIIHHKFIVIDAEGDNPVIFTGSANMSNNAQYNNDENLLQIRGAKDLAACYFAEFLRLYEQYRARADWLKRKKAEAKGKTETYKLTPDASWAKKYFAKDSPAERARINMAN
jgi:phosphatidylserine/phosphatidylglycerophosphate/cardiolipin synthase-like enzyme